MLIYLAGPLSAKNLLARTANIDVAAQVFFTLVRQGLPAYCPHFSGLHIDAWKIDEKCWKRYDLRILSQCSHIYMLPRWETSLGARRERAYAKLHKKIVVYSVEELL